MTIEAAPSDLPLDPRLTAAVQEYLARLEAGQNADRAEFLTRYADLAEPLALCLDGLELVHRAAVREHFPAHGHATADSSIAADNPLGDFKILRELGRGGMGIVYEAEQLSLGRRVAVKVLPFAAAFDTKHLHRFRKEAQAAAQLHHTNIVPVYAVGSERGVHFYAMQLINGQSLADIIRKLRSDAGRTSRDAEASRPMVAEPTLPIAQSAKTTSQLGSVFSSRRNSRKGGFFFTAAEYIIQAADALEHAHQFGVIHRDIKPANLLVDGHNRVWVTDFGLAQIHADTNLTQTGDLMGTLRYMSPEQASGHRSLLDPRTDVYSLGATLYELVTLEPVFNGANRQQLLHQIINDEPKPPRSLDATIPVELETILLKAVSKSPADRFASAQDFAADLRRYLHDEPIHAKRPGPVERMRKWGRRHPSMVGAGLLLLLICTAGSLAGNWMIAREQARTVAALEREQRRADEANLRFRQARQAVDLLVRQCEQELGSGPRTRAVCQRLLKAALGYYDDFQAQYHGDPGTEAELAAGRERVLKILQDLTTAQFDLSVGWMTFPDVQAELRLAHDQKDAVAKWWSNWMQARTDFFQEQRSQGVDGRIERYAQLAGANEAALAEILDPKQLHRFRQVVIQLRGPRPFEELPLADQLRLTPSQRRRIREIKEESEIFRGPGGKSLDPGPGDRRDSPDRWLKRELDQVLELLTPEQLQKYRDLTGVPFPGAPHARHAPT